MLEERLVAGLRCSEVMLHLSDYVDGELPAPDVARIEEHLRGCDWCEQFGGDFAAAVEALRTALADEQPLDSTLRSRLRESLRRRL